MLAAPRAGGASSMAYEVGAFGGFGGPATPDDGSVVHVFWLSGMSCDGCSVATLGAISPRIEELTLGLIPRVPRVVLHHPMLDEDCGAAFMQPFAQAAAGALDAPYVVVVEGSIPDDQSFGGPGHFAAMGAGSDWPQARGSVAGGDQPVRATEWMWALAAGAGACIAIVTCATWGGIPSPAGNITGSMGLADY